MKPMSLNPRKHRESHPTRFRERQNHGGAGEDQRRHEGRETDALLNGAERESPASILDDGD